MTPPRIAIDLGSTDIKTVWMTADGDFQAIHSMPTPTQTDGDNVTYPPKKMLETLESIPDQFSFDGPWEATIASQRSTFILWDNETGNPLTPLISWRDRRAEPWVQNLSEHQFNMIRERTGLRPEAGYPLPKLRWLLDNNPELRRKKQKDSLQFGSLDTWLLWWATRGDAWFMDPTQASRTMLYNLRENQWDKKLLDEFSISQSMLPEIKSHFDDPIPVDRLWTNCQVVNTIGDQPASTIGGQSPPYDKTRVTLGTAGFVASPIDESQCPNALVHSFTPTASHSDFIHQAEGVVLSAGRAVDWLINTLDINMEHFQEFMSLQSDWSDELPTWCPALNGVGAPFWSNRPAVFNKFTEDTSTRDLCQGLVVSILMRINDILEIIPTSNSGILMDGGLSKIDNLPTIASTIWGASIDVTRSPHLTCRGALIASDWSKPYLDDDPWENFNLQSVEPAQDLPVESWHTRWKDSLEEWSLERE